MTLAFFNIILKKRKVLITGIYVFYFLFPLIVIWLINSFNFLNKIGSIVIVYIVGILLGNTNILPENILETQDMITTITIPLAIPLLIFNFNIRKWLTLARTTFISLIITVFSVILIVVISTFIFNDNSGEYWKVPGMLVGVYTGGTPNLAAIKTALDVDSETYILTHTFDMIFSSIYLLFLMVLGRPFFSLFLKKYQSYNINSDFNISEKQFSRFFEKKSIKEYPKSLAVSIVIFAIAGGLSLLVSSNYSMLVAILSITTFAIIASFIPRINQFKSAPDLGMYFILVFSLVVASMADFSNFSLTSVYLFLNIGFVIFGSIVLQLILSKIFKIDTDTTIITSTALICSPPFVPVIAGAIKNKEIIFSGLTVGIIGYAIGNYLGILIAYLLK